MDSTLQQLLRGLFEYSQTIDGLQAQLAERDQRIVDLENEVKSLQLAAETLLKTEAARNA